MTTRTGAVADDLPFERLPPQRRRRLTVLAVVRSIAVSVVLLTGYFLLPFTRVMQGQLGAFVAGMLVLTVVVVAEFWLTARATYPRLRAMEAVLTCAPLFLVVFAAAHYVVGFRDAGSYSEPMSRLDALYFSMTTFATVGYGDITPRSELARTLALVQMAAGLILVGVIARILIGLARERSAGRADTK